MFLLGVAALVATTLWFAAMQRGSIGFGKLTPMPVFKCEIVRIGNGCTIGAAAFVH